jgi:hypothetical protein
MIKQALELPSLGSRGFDREARAGLVEASELRSLGAFAILGFGLLMMMLVLLPRCFSKDG